MRLRWSARAQRDLAEIADFIAADDSAAALRWVKRLQQRARLAAASPGSGRVVPEWNEPHVREVFLRTYRIVSAVGRADVVVLTVLEGHRRLTR